MNKFFKVLTSSIGVAFCGIVFSPAYAQVNYYTELNKTIKSLGAQGTGFYVFFVEPVNSACPGGIMYVDPSKKGLYTQLLAAKLTGKRLSRIDFNQSNGAACNLDLVEISE
ncbi:hypothetical protein ACN9MY_15080 [Pseudoduganella sp. R-31]|uniref:hypothetical protein n=1 Tax=Pseudoduganella sp. R-31 TaxID=3404060 RepID=UPI003CE8A6FD